MDRVTSEQRPEGGGSLGDTGGSVLGRGTARAKALREEQEEARVLEYSQRQLRSQRYSQGIGGGGVMVGVGAQGQLTLSTTQCPGCKHFT